MVYALGLTELTSWGIIYYAFGVLLTPMQRELGWSQTQLTGAFGVAMLVAGLAAVAVGRVLDRHGARAVMTIGSVAATLLLVAWAGVGQLSSFYLIWAGLGACMAAILYEPAFQVVATWLPHDRGRAMTALTIGGGLASVIFIPLTTALVSGLGWRGALLVLAGLLAVITIPLHALVLRGLPPAAPATLEASPLAPVAPGVTVGAAVRGATFWWFVLAVALSTAATMTINVHLVSYALRHGATAALSATAAGLLGAAQIPSRIVIAALGRRVSQQTLIIALSGLQALALVVVLAVPAPPGLLLFAALFGAGSGALTPTRAALLAEVYGSSHYGSISGLLAFLTTLIRAGAPVAASLLVARTHTYAPVLWALLAGTLVSAAAMVIGWRLRPARAAASPLPSIEQGAHA